MAGRLDELRAAFAATVLRQPGDLCRVLERLAYDDAILFDDGSRLEYVHLDEGKPQFRLYESDLRLIGVVLVHADAYLPAIHRRLTAYLEQRGTPLRRVQYKECGALTPAGAKVHYLPQLFRYAPKAKKKKAEGAKVDKQHA
jgi:hypothetical protein